MPDAPLPSPPASWVPQLHWPALALATARPARWLAWVDVLQLVAVAGALVWCARTLASPAPFEYAESDTATWAWMLRHGEPIYGPLAGLPMRLTHYPPLHLWLVARLAPSDGAIMTVARLLSLSGLLSTILMARLCVLHATGSRRAGASVALLLLVTFQLVYFGASARADLFALGLAVAAMTAVALRARGWPVIAGVLFALAILCKHNLIALALGALVWASWRRPLQALLLALSLAAVLGVVVWRLELFTPLVTWTHTSWRLSNLRSIGYNDLLPLSAALVGIVQLLRMWRRIPERAAGVLEPWLVAAGVGTVWLLALARVGASTNYLLEWLVAISLLSCAAAHLGIASHLQRLHVFIVSTQTLIRVVPLVLLFMPRAETELAAARRMLATGSGPVLVERTWLAGAAGRPPLIIPFFATQLARRHLWSDAPLTELAEQRKLPRVLLDFSLDDPAPNPCHLDRFPPALLAALRARYVLAEQVGQLRLYVPAPD